MNRTEPPARPPEIPWDRATQDVILDRTPHLPADDSAPIEARQRYNIVQTIWLDCDVGFDWGNDSLASATLSINILSVFLPPANPVACSAWHMPVPCAPLTVLLAADFTDTFIRPVPFWGSILRGADVRSWIRRARHQWANHGVNLDLRTLAERYPLDASGRPVREAVGRPGR